MNRIRPFAIAIAAILTLGAAPLAQAQQIQDAAETGAVTGSITKIDVVNSTRDRRGPERRRRHLQGARNDTGIMNGAKKIAIKDLQKGWRVVVNYDTTPERLERREADRGRGSPDAVGRLCPPASALRGRRRRRDAVVRHQLEPGIPRRVDARLERALDVHVRQQHAGVARQLADVLHVRQGFARVPCPRRASRRDPATAPPAGAACT